MPMLLVNTRSIAQQWRKSTTTYIVLVVLLCLFVWMKGEASRRHINGFSSVNEPVREIAHGRQKSRNSLGGRKASSKKSRTYFLLVWICLVVTITLFWPLLLPEFLFYGREGTPQPSSSKGDHHHIASNLILLPWHFEVMDVSETNSGILCETWNHMNKLQCVFSHTTLLTGICL